METFFIILFIVVFSVALVMIAYTLYGMSKKMPTTASEDKEDLLNERASTIAVDAAGHHILPIGFARLRPRYHMVEVQLASR